MVILWLARHAQPLVAPGTCYGRLDVPAEPAATQAAAQALAQALPTGLRTVSSPLQRCTQLAESLCQLWPPATFSTDTRLAELDETRPVACLCHHGARSQRVAVFLEQNGFAHVVNIAGGIDAWSGELDTAVARY